MLRLRRCLLLAVCLLGIRAAATETDWWENLALHNLAGARLMPQGRWIVIVFLSPECPVANASIPTLNALAAAYAPRGFDFIGAYADPTLDLAALRRHGTDYRLRFATVDDREQRLVHAAGAKFTPEVFVYSRAGALLYRGRIDDRVEELGAARPKAAHEDLRDVLAALAAGETGPFANHPGFGCAIPEPVKR
jgi:hypothetical protein